MKKVVAVILIAPALVFYCIGAFVLWQINPAEWSEYARGNVALFTFIGWFIACGAAGASGVFD